MQTALYLRYMITGLYEQIWKMQDMSADLFIQAMQEFTNGLFDRILNDNEFHGQPLKKAIIMYIIIAYSYDSEMIVMSFNQATERDKIMSIAKVPDAYRGAVVLLQNISVRQTVLKYLDAQGEFDWAHLKKKETIYNDLMEASVEDFTDESGKKDFKKILENSKYCDTLYAEMEALKEKIREKFRHPLDRIEEVKKLQEITITDTTERPSVETWNANRNNQNVAT